MLMTKPNKVLSRTYTGVISFTKAVVFAATAALLACGNGAESEQLDSTDVSTQPTAVDSQASENQSNNIAGTVTGASGTEAGVWVIAETTYPLLSTAFGCVVTG